MPDPSQWRPWQVGGNRRPFRERSIAWLGALETRFPPMPLNVSGASRLHNYLTSPENPYARPSVRLTLCRNDRPRECVRHERAVMYVTGTLAGPRARLARIVLHTHCARPASPERPPKMVHGWIIQSAARRRRRGACLDCAVFARANDMIEVRGCWLLVLSIFGRRPFRVSCASLNRAGPAFRELCNEPTLPPSVRPDCKRFGGARMFTFARRSAASGAGQRLRLA